MNEKKESFNAGSFLEKAKERLLHTSSDDKIENIKINEISPNPDQPRKNFDDATLKGLAQSIKENGVLQPIIIRRVSDEKVPFQIVIGERRWRASKLVGKETIPSVIKPISDADATKIALIENVQREDMNFWDTAKAYIRLKELYNNAEGVSNTVGKEKRTVERYCKIYNEINRMPKIAELVAAQPEEINYTCAFELSECIADIMRLEKSNNRDFEKILKNLKIKGIKNCVSLLKKKFNKKAVSKQSCNDVFRETEKELILNVRIKKNDSVSPAFVNEVRDSVVSFVDRLDTICNSANLAKTRE